MVGAENGGEGRDSNPRMVSHRGQQAGRCLNQRRPLRMKTIKSLKDRALSSLLRTAL
jgi:hypothetical protein